MKEIKFSVQESLTMRRAYLGFFIGLSLILFDINADTTIGNPVPWFFSVVSFTSAVLIMIKPEKDLLWLLLGLSLSLQVLAKLPVVKNHSVLFAAVGVAIAVSYLNSRFSRRASLENWVNKSEPFLRMIFFAGYGAAAISKLNSGFFDYTVSCANSMAVDVYAWLPFKIPFETFAWMPYLVAGTEMFVFLGLMFAKTRPWALATGALFHLGLSLDVHSAAMSFNPALFALFMLFLPPAASEWLTLKWRQIGPRAGSNKQHTMIFIFALIAAAIFIWFKLTPLGSHMLWPAFLLRLAFSIGMVLLLAYCAIRFRNEPLRTRTVAVPSLMAGVALGIVLLNAASPYLGGKTGATFTMFSNLRVEGGTSNHFFIPRLPVDSLQDDLVAITSSSNPRLQSKVKSGELITYLTLQQTLATSPKDSVSFIRDGKEVVISKVADSNLLDGYDPFWGIFPQYRGVPIKGTCVW